MNLRRAVFLDRDGVLNRTNLVEGAPRPPSSLEDIEILPGVVKAIQILRVHDFLPVVVTNQPDVARRITSKSNVEAINAHIGAATGIEYFYTCFHDDTDLCNCRKPSPGLLLRASKDLGLNPRKSFMVGDRWRDISAGQSAGCETFFIDYSYNEHGPQEPFTPVSSLLEAVELIVGGKYEAK